MKLHVEGTVCPVYYHLYTTTSLIFQVKGEHSLISSDTFQRNDSLLLI